MITVQQWREIQKIQENLKGRIGSQEVTKESIAAAMQEYNGNLNYDTAFSICSRIADGREVFCQFYNSEDLKEPGYADRMLGRITEKMDQEEQRKGFYLQCLDSFEQNQSSPEETAARAALPEQELKELLISRIGQFAQRFAQQFARSAMDGVKGILRDYDLQERHNGSRLESREIEDELFLFAAAEYLASLSGTLLLEFGESPELLGIGAAAQMAMAEYESEYTAEKAEWYEDSYRQELIMMTAVGAAFTIGSVVIGIAAEAVWALMATSTLGVILAVILQMGWCIAFAIGISGLLCGIGGIVEECIMRYQERKAEENADNKAASKWTEWEVEEKEFVFQS